MVKEMSANETETAMTVASLVDQRIAALIGTGTIAPGKKRRKGRNWESKMAYEYVSKFYANQPTWFRVSVGPVPGGSNDPLYYKLRRWADVIVVMPKEVLIIETKMMAKPDVVGQLNNYAQLFPQTPMFERYWSRPVKKRVVCSLIDGATKEFIESSGIEVEVFKGSNYEEWYNAVILKKDTTQTV